MFVSAMGLTLLLAFALQCPDGTPPPCRGARAAAPAMSVAVLDFQNLSRDTADAYLSAGLAEELTARLGQVQRLQVASRSAVRRLADARSRALADIGRSLNVTYVVDGSVRRAGSRLRVTVELLRAASGRQEWTALYDRSEADLLSLQEAVASEVATAVAGRLLPAERRTLATRPTTSAEAYQLYLRARTLHRVAAAAPLLERAVLLDGGFAQAWAELSQVHSAAWWYYRDRSQATLARAREAADRALRAGPNLADGHVALGYLHYWGRLDYGSALTEFAAALAIEPNNADVHAAVANVARRQGNWEIAFRSRERALALTPDDPQELLEYGLTHWLMRRLEAADSLIGRALQLSPDFPLARAFDVMLAIARGRTVGDSRSIAWLRARPEAALEAVLGAQNMGILVAVQRDSTLARAVMSMAVPADSAMRACWLLVRAVVGRDASSAAEMAAVLEELIRQRPDEDAYRSYLGLAYALSSRPGDALREAREAVRLLPTERDAVRGTARLKMLADIMFMAGDAPGALSMLERVLAQPGYLTGALLRADPLYQPLHGQPPFERLLAGN